MGVTVKLGVKADKAAIGALRPDTIFMAEGSVPIIPKLEGIEKAMLAQEVLLGNIKAKDSAAPYGTAMKPRETCNDRKHVIPQEMNDSRQKFSNKKALGFQDSSAFVFQMIR